MAEIVNDKLYVDEGQTTKMWSVWNTANRMIYVLAQNQATAVRRAEVCGHIKDKVNATAVLAAMDNPEPHEEKFFASVRAAIRDGRQGVVKNMDGFAVVGGRFDVKTYAPINEVKLG